MFVSFTTLTALVSALSIDVNLNGTSSHLTTPYGFANDTPVYIEYIQQSMQQPSEYTKEIVIEIPQLVSDQDYCYYTFSGRNVAPFHTDDTFLTIGIEYLQGEYDFSINAGDTNVRFNAYVGITLEFFDNNNYEWNSMNYFFSFANPYDYGQLYYEQIAFTSPSYKLIGGRIYILLFNTSEITTNGYNDGYSDGYDDGYAIGKVDGFNLGQTTDTNIQTLFSTIIDTPIVFLRKLFGYELFGIDIFVALTTIISLLVALSVFRLVKGIF